MHLHACIMCVNACFKYQFNGKTFIGMIVIGTNIEMVVMEHLLEWYYQFISVPISMVNKFELWLIGY